MTSHDDIRREFDKFLNPSRLRSNLLLGALYLAVFEVLKTIIVDDLISFFATGDDYQNGKPVRTDQYLSEIAKHDRRDVYRASCLWLKDMKAINLQDVDQLLAIRKHRNVITHELPRVLLDAKLDVDLSLLTRAHGFVHRLDRWWFENYHAVIDREPLEGARPDEVQFISSRMAYIDYVIASALADQRTAKESQ